MLNRRGDESRVGSNPTLSTTCARIAQLPERRSYKAEVLGSNPSACTGHAALAQWIQEFLVSTQEVAGSSPARRTNSIMASSHSGLVALPRKQMVGQPARRFESFTRLHASITDGKSSNGRTADSDSANVGSTPTFPASSSMVALAQAARVPGCELGGCGFEPRTSLRHIKRTKA